MSKSEKRNWTTEDVANHWDDTTHYDEINEETYSYFRRFTDGYRLSSIKRESKVLDISCRTGKGSLYFSKQIPGLTTVCADVSKRMLDIAEKRLSSNGVDFSTAFIKKFSDLPFDKDQFDAILSFETIEHVPNPKGFLEELFRVLRPGGQMVLTTPNPSWEFIHWFAAVTGIHHGEGPHKFIGRAELNEYLSGVGFRVEGEETTVLIPDGPRFLTRLGEIIEERLKKIGLMEYIGLRRIFICHKPS